MVNVKRVLTERVTLWRLFFFFLFFLQFLRLCWSIDFDIIKQQQPTTHLLVVRADTGARDGLA